MNLVTLTPAADQQVSILCNENDCFAISLDVKGGGCAGFEYEWSTATQEDLKADDFLVECDQGNFIVTGHSLMFLAGSEIDYVKSIIGSTFEIKNPNAQSSCGCGVSINFDIDNLAQESDRIMELK
jgi:iron-sulfur cluster assembly accessory protein